MDYFEYQAKKHGMPPNEAERRDARIFERIAYPFHGEQHNRDADYTRKSRPFFAQWFSR